MRNTHLFVATLGFLAISGVLSAGAIGCSSSSPSAAAGSTSDAGADASTCADGFQALGDPGGCVPIVPSSACAGGTMETIGKSDCAPVGPTCAAPFVPSPSGYGCDAPIPATACTGATRDAVGSATCVPVGDCNAAFPPPGATIFVDDSYTAGQLDGTHFANVASALAAAPSGAVIAVEAGNYSDTMAPNVGVSIVGRCAEQVIFTSPDAKTAGLNVGKAIPVSLSGVTLRGYRGAVFAVAGSLTVDSVVIEDAIYTGIALGNTKTTAKISNVVVRGTRGAATDTSAFGLYIGYGAQATVESSSFADNDYINVGVSGDGTAGATLGMKSSVVRDGHPFGASGGYGWGIYAADKVTVTVDGSVLANNHGFGALAHTQTTGVKSAASLTLTGSVVRGTTLDPVNKQGMGVESSGSAIDIENSTIADSTIFDVYAGDGASTKIASSALLGAASTDPSVLGPIGLGLEKTPATVQSTVIADTRVGAQIQGASAVEMDDSLVAGTRTSASGYYDTTDKYYVGIGIFTESPSSLTIARSTIANAHTGGLLALGHVDATNLLVVGTRAGGDGIAGRAVSGQGSASLTLRASAILDNTETGILVADHTSLDLEQCTVDQTALDSTGVYGMGVFIGEDDAVATVNGCTVRHSLGPALAVAASGATVTSSVVVDNTIGVAVVGGSSLVEGDPTDAPMTVAISKDTIFANNQTRVGSGDIPLPSVLATPK